MPSTIRRLIVVDAPAPPVVGAPPGSTPAEHASFGVPYWEWEDGNMSTRLIGVDGPLFAPEGAPPRWEPRRRAAIRALTKLAGDGDVLLIDSDDPLFCTQVRDLIGGVTPPLLRSARRAAPPWAETHAIDDLAAEARATAGEIDAIVSHLLRNLDPDLTLDDLAVLGATAEGARSPASLVADGVPEASIVRMAKHGFVVDDPCWSTPAGDALWGLLPDALRAPDVATTCAGWVDAVRRGTLDRVVARERVMDLVGQHRPLRKPSGFDDGRLLGVCPTCGDWMGGVRQRLRCMGCGRSYPLPRATEARAVPGQTCGTCRAPIIRPIVHGRVAPVRCPDRAGCPEAMDAIRPQ